jgi:hypothetical protein
LLRVVDFAVCVRAWQDSVEEAEARLSELAKAKSAAGWGRHGQLVVDGKTLSECRI